MTAFAAAEGCAHVLFAMQELDAPVQELLREQPSELGQHQPDAGQCGGFGPHLEGAHCVVLVRAKQQDEALAGVSKNWGRHASTRPFASVRKPRRGQQVPKRVGLAATVLRQRVDGALQADRILYDWSLNMLAGSLDFWPVVFLPKTRRPVTSIVPVRIAGSAF